MKVGIFLLVRTWALRAVLAVFVSGCARLPAQCAKPSEQIPEAPHAQANRRLVTSLAQRDAQACHVKVRLPDETTASSWLVERDAAVRAAQAAAQACCANPRLKNVADWPAGFTAFDVEFECAAQAP